MDTETVAVPDTVLVLVVDDEPAIADMISMNLEGQGYTCLTAQNGDAALDLLDKKLFDVVITDIKMPGISGIELLQKIKEKHDSHVIVMTGFTEEYDYVSIIKAGASEFIQKPVDLKSLSVRLKNVLHFRYLLLERDITNRQFQKNVNLILNYSKILKLSGKEAPPSCGNAPDQPSEAAGHLKDSSGMDSEASAPGENEGGPGQGCAPIFQINDTGPEGAGITMDAGLLQKMVDSMFGLVSITDMAGNIQFTNASHAILGYEPEALAGKNIFDFVHPEDMAHVKSVFTESVNSLDSRKTRYRYRDAREAYRWFETKGEFLLDRHGNPEAIIFYTNDITEHANYREALHESEANYRLLLENLNEGVLKLDPDGTITFANDRITDIAGYTPDEMPGKHITEFLDPPSAGEARKCLQKCENGDRSEFEAASIRKDETKADIILAANPIFGAHNRYAGAMVNVRDITKQKQAEKKLQKSQERLLTFMNAIEAIVYVADMETYEILFVNDYGRNIWGTDIVGKKCWQAIQKNQEGPCPFCTNDKLLNADGNPAGGYKWEFRNTLNGRRYECHDYAIQWIDGRRARMEIATDITGNKGRPDQKKDSEKRFSQAKKLESICQMANGAGYGLRQMQNTILEHVERSLETVHPSKPLHWNLKKIKNAALRSIEITEDLTGCAPNKAATPRKINLNRGIERSLTMMQHHIGENIVLDWQPGNGDWTIEMDPLQLNQLLTHLAVNAKDAIGGSGTITIETESFNLYGACPGNQAGSDGSREFVVLCVKDDGCGMDRQTLDKILEPSFTTKSDGTGMGLPEVYDILSQNNGFLHVSSKPGKGSAFKIHLPCCEEKPSEKLSNHPQAAGELPGWERACP